ncbi:hypothetical protein ACHAWF_017321 [Thalassiosira exigua]
MFPPSALLARSSGSSPVAMAKKTSPKKRPPGAASAAASSAALPAPPSCKCVKSKCLLLYCECYRRGVTCGPKCVCIDCRNTPERAAVARKKERLRKEREGGGVGDDGGFDWGTTPGDAVDPGADDDEQEGCFAGTCQHGEEEEAIDDRAKLPSRSDVYLAGRSGRASRSLDLAKFHRGSGCSCKNSRCMKKYCVCYGAGVECTFGRCKCHDCRNPFGANGGRAAAARALARGGGQHDDDCCGGDVEEDKILQTRPGMFKTPKKRTGKGCSCHKNKCITKYCDCNARGTGCDPAVCTCINCENMMKPLSELEILEEHELPREDADDVGLYVPKEPAESRIKGLEHWSHRIDDFEGRRVADPQDKLVGAYLAREEAQQKARKVIDEEAAVRAKLEEETRALEAELEGHVKEEGRALEHYRRETNNVMCLEMFEPCRWNRTYQKLKEYVMRKGDLPPVPSACAAEEDRRISIWVQEQKSLVYSGAERITNAPHRIEALEALGIEWVETSETRWNKMLGRLAEHKGRHGTAKLPPFMQCRRSKDQQLIALRHWVDQQEQAVKSGTLPMEKLKKLQAIGLPVKMSWDQEWKYYTVQLLKFRSKHGHLYVTGSNDEDLKKFVSKVLKRIETGSKVKLTPEERADLRAKGLFNDIRNIAKNPTGMPPTQAEVMVPLERVKEVNYWTGMLEQLKAYKEEHGNLEFLPNRGGDGGTVSGRNKHDHLRDWVENQRRAYKNRALEESRVKALSRLGLVFDPWESTFRKLQKFKREAGTARLPKVGPDEDEELAELCRWSTEQIKLYRKGALHPDRKKKLRKLGVYLTKGHMGKTPWELRFEEMMDYFHDHKTCLPKRDGPLRQWVLELVDLLENGYVSLKRQQIIERERIGPYLTSNVILKGLEPSRNKKRKVEPDERSRGVKKAKAEAPADTAEV